jgi:beta-glucosidase
VSIDVQNTGSCEGQEVVQVYVRDVTASVQRPEKELKAFAKVALKPGETTTVTLTLNQESFAFYDEAIRQWVAEAGEFEVLVGSSSQDIRATAQFTLKQSVRFGGTESTKARFGMDTTLRQLVSQEETRKILKKYLPSLCNLGHYDMFMGFSLEQIAGFAPQVLTDEVIRELTAELAEL